MTWISGTITKVSGKNITINMNVLPPKIATLPVSIGNEWILDVALNHMMKRVHSGIETTEGKITDIRDQHQFSIEENVRKMNEKMDEGNHEL